MKYQASPITDSFWIIEFAGRKCGVMFKTEHGYSIVITGEDSLDGIDESDIRDFVEFLSPRQEPKKQEHLNTIDGYEIEYDTSFNHVWQDGVPVFNKTQNSKIRFAAGWYAANFPKTGWLTLFCPKHKTLLDFEFTGPFKNKEDAQFSIKQLLRDGGKTGE